MIEAIAHMAGRRCFLDPNSHGKFVLIENGGPILSEINNVTIRVGAKPVRALRNAGFDHWIKQGQQRYFLNPLRVFAAGRTISAFNVCIHEFFDLGYDASGTLHLEANYKVKRKLE